MDTFDLEKSVTQWRATFEANHGVTTDAVDELESHLRDGMEQLEEARLTREEAFLVAARRVGSADVLEPEYARVSPQTAWVRPLFWMTLGVVGFSTAMSLTSTIGSFASFGVASWMPVGSVSLWAGICHGLVVLALIAAAVVGWIYLARGDRLGILPAIGSHPVRSLLWAMIGAVLVKAGVLVLTVWSSGVFSPVMFGHVALSGSIADALIRVILFGGICALLLTLRKPMAESGR
jgi:hypothetical protein